MGKGDKKSKRGKIVIGSFGVRRRRKKSSVPHPAPEPVKSKVKDVADATEKVLKKAETPEVIEEKPKVVKSKKKTTSGEPAPDLPVQE